MTNLVEGAERVVIDPQYNKIARSQGRIFRVEGIPAFALKKVATGS